MSIFPQKNSWLLPLPDNWEPENYRTLPVCIPDSDEWEAIFYEHLSTLGLQHKWARDETREGAKTVAGRWRETWAFNRVLGGCAQENEGVIWYETPDDIDGERGGSPTTEILGNVALLGLMALIGPTGIVIYEAVSPLVEIWFEDSIPNLLGKLIVNDADEVLVPLLGEGGFKKIILELDRTRENNTIRLENATQGAELRSSDTIGEIRVVRRNIAIVTDESMYRLRQSPSNPLIMQQSWDGGVTWSTAYNYGNLGGGGGGGGGGGRTYTEQQEYNQTLIQQFNQLVVNNTTINQNTAYDGSVNDKYKRDALCITLETLIRGYHETFKGAPQSATEYYETTWVTTGLIGAGLSFVAFALPFAPAWVTYVAMGGAFTALAGTVVEFMAVQGIIQAPAIVINSVSDEMLDEYLCSVINKVIYPVTQDNLNRAFEQAFEDMPSGTDEEKYMKSLAYGFAQFMGTREMYSSLINVWGDTALGMQAIDATYDGCLCWTRICKNPNPYTITLAPYPSNEVVKRAQVNDGGYLIGGQSSYPVTGGRLWQVGVNYEFTMVNPIGRIDSIYIPSAIEGSNAGNGFRTLSFWKGTTLRRGYNTYQLDALGVPKNTIELDLTDNPIMDVDRIVSRVWVQNMPTEAMADGQSAWVDTNKMVICGLYPA